jgi:hypothetical protein
MSVTCNTRCPVCDDRAYEKAVRDPATQEFAGINAIAYAISRGDDLGGVFELGVTLAKARATIRPGNAIDTAEVHKAVVGVQAAHKRVAAEFARLTDSSCPCRVCKLRDQLNHLITCAADAVREQKAGPALASCNELAYYAGDNETDAGATREVLKRARDVFLAALAAKSPDLAW